MISPEVRQLIIIMLNSIMNTTEITKRIEMRTALYEEEYHTICAAVNVLDYSKERIQKQLDPDDKMLALLQDLERTKEKYAQDLEPLIRKREMYLNTQNFLKGLYYPLDEIMTGLYIKHSKEKDIRISLGLSIPEFIETHEEGIEATAQFLKENGYEPEGD